MTLKKNGAYNTDWKLVVVLFVYNFYLTGWIIHKVSLTPMVGKEGAKAETKEELNID